MCWVLQDFISQELCHPSEKPRGKFGAGTDPLGPIRRFWQADSELCSWGAFENSLLTVGHRRPVIMERGTVSTCGLRKSYFNVDGRLLGRPDSLRIELKTVCLKIFLSLTVWCLFSFLIILQIYWAPTMCRMSFLNLGTTGQSSFPCAARETQPLRTWL